MSDKKEKKRRGERGAAVDYTRAKAMYLFGRPGITLSEVAEACGHQYQAMAAKAAAEGWQDERRKIMNDMMTKAKKAFVAETSMMVVGLVKEMSELSRHIGEARRKREAKGKALKPTDNRALAAAGKDIFATMVGAGVAIHAPAPQEEHEEAADAGALDEARRELALLINYDGPKGIKDLKK